MNYLKKLWWLWYWIVGILFSFLIYKISTPQNPDFGPSPTIFLVIILFLLPLFLMVGLVLCIRKAESKKLILNKQILFWIWLILIVLSILFVLFVFIAGP